MEDELIDGLCTIHDVADERMAERILVRAFGLVGRGYAYAAHFALMDVVGTEKEVIFAVGSHDGRRPQGASQPTDAVL